MPDHSGVQFALMLADGSQTVPQSPTTVPADSYMIWPFNFDLNGTTLKSSTAQLLCRLDAPEPCFVFFTIPGVKPQFDFDSRANSGIDSAPGSFEVRAPDGRKARIILLTRDQALHRWKANLWGRDRLLFSKANVFADGSTLRLESDDPYKAFHRNLPAASSHTDDTRKTLSQSNDGTMAIYSATQPAKKIDVAVHQILPALARCEISKSARAANPFRPMIPISNPPPSGKSPSPRTLSTEVRTFY